MKIKPIYHTEMRTSISRTPEFEKKLLATHGVNVGLKCGHGCTYCFTPALLRTHPAFKEIGKNPYDHSYSIVDPKVLARIKKDVKKVGPEDTAMVCTYTDAWSHESKQFDLGKSILETLLEDGTSQVRILTKNISVKEDFDYLKKYSERVKVGLSITSSPHQNSMAIAEPYASTNKERISTLIEAHNSGLRTYAMICPCIPEVASSPASLKEIISSVMPADPEEIWVEPINARGPVIKSTAEAFQEKKYFKIARALNYIRNGQHWSTYAKRLTQNVLDVSKNLGVEGKMHILLYENNFNRRHVRDLRKKDSGKRIVWL